LPNLRECVSLPAKKSEQPKKGCRLGCQSQQRALKAGIGIPAYASPLFPATHQHQIAVDRRAVVVAQNLRIERLDGEAEIGSA